MADTKGPEIAIRRSMLGRARGLGAAKSGTAHWWAMKATSVALIPLTLWLLFSLIGLQGATRAEVAAWASGPITATLLLATLAALFQHMYLGVQTVIEDYIHDERPRIVWLMVAKGAAWLLGLASAISVLKLAFTG
jgi:succinate dehydrogenase / fumarate reductase membrane anchor subunit